MLFKNIWYFGFVKFSAISLQTWQYILIYLDSIGNVLILPCHSAHNRKFLYSNKLLPFNMKLINPIQKYPHFIESYAYSL